MILGLPTYRVNAAARGPLLQFMIGALEDAGCRILFSSPPNQAPFVISFQTTDGERMGVVAYAFLATRTPTKNRPSDERSFQIKYGSKQDDNVHLLWQDPLGLVTTVLVGIDPEGGFFVAADPEVHNPTKFFIRVEFKDEHAAKIKRKGWHAWERTKRSSDGMTPPVEVLLGGTRASFLDLIRFERAAYGLPPGERQLLADRRDLIPAASIIESSVRESPVPFIHPLLNELQMQGDAVFELISKARRLKMAVRGWVAEEHLRRTLEQTPGITQCDRLDEEGGPDILVRYRGGTPIYIECKNVLRIKNRAGLPRIDFQRTRAAKGDPCSRYYSPRDFNVVAGCLHAVTERWEFRYAMTDMLNPHQKCPGKLASNVLVDDRWSSDATSVFAAAAKVAARLQ